MKFNANAQIKKLISEKIKLIFYTGSSRYSLQSNAFEEKYGCQLCWYIKENMVRHKRSTNIVVLQKLHHLLHEMQNNLLLDDHTKSKYTPMELFGSNGPYSQIVTEIVRLICEIERENEILNEQKKLEQS